MTAHCDTPMRGDKVNEREQYRMTSVDGGPWHQLTIYPDGQGWRVECDCGWLTRWHKERDDAKKDADEQHARRL